MKPVLAALAGLTLFAQVGLSTPSQIASVPLGGGVSVATRGSNAFVLNGDGLTILDLSNPATPSVTGTLPITYTNPGGVGVSGNLAFLACYDGWHGAMWQGLEGVDITDLSHPRALWTIPSDEDVDPKWVRASGSLVTFDYRLYDISDATHPTITQGGATGEFYPSGDVCVSLDQRYESHVMTLEKYSAGSFAPIDSMDLGTQDFAFYPGESGQVCQQDRTLYISGRTSVAVNGSWEYREKLLVVEFDGSGFHVVSSHVGTTYSFANGFYGKLRVVDGIAYVLDSGGISTYVLSGTSMMPVGAVPVPGSVQDFEIMGDLLLATTSDSFLVYRLGGSNPDAPHITAEPASQRANVGDTVTFGVTATGAAPLTYQWYFNWQPLPGATASTLTINDAQMTNLGSYCVLVNNTVGYVRSNVVTLFGTALVPTITGQPQDRVATTAVQL